MPIRYIKTWWRKRQERKRTEEKLRKMYISYSYRREPMTQVALIKELKQSENIFSNAILSDEDIIQIFLFSENTVSICSSIYLISLLNITDKRIVLRLFELLLHDEEFIRPFSVTLFREIISKSDLTDRKIEQQLLNLLKHEEEAVRRAAAELLTKVDTIEALTAVVGGGNHGKGIRIRAAFQLEKFGEKAIVAIPALLALMNAKEINYQRHFPVFPVLQAIGEKAIPTLVTLLDNEDEDVRRYAAHTLKYMEITPNLRKRINETLKETESGIS